MSREERWSKGSKFRLPKVKPIMVSIGNKKVELGVGELVTIDAKGNVRRYQSDGNAYFHSRKQRHTTRNPRATGDAITY